MALYDSLSDAQLVVLLQDGDRKAFGQLYTRYWGILYAYARKMLGNNEDAGDVVQDIFVKLWTRAVTIDPDQNISGWLYASMRHHIINAIMKEKRFKECLTSLEKDLDTLGTPADEQLREKDLAAAIEREVEKLPEKMQKVFRASRFAHLTYKEIADELQVTEGTVKKQVYYALKILRSRLDIFILWLLLQAFL